MARSKKKSFRANLIYQLNLRFSREVSVTFINDYQEDIISNGTRPAINSFGNDRVEFFATNWFENYLFFIKIKLITDQDITRIFSSVSFFQEVGDEPKQLFRAEWDNYPLIEGYNHPQPHWHFTAQLSDKISFENLGEEDNIFADLVGNSRTINLDRMHFAMAGDWISNGNMNCSVNDENTLVDWLIYLFRHVRQELEYKMRKK